MQQIFVFLKGHESPDESLTVSQQQKNRKSDETTLNIKIENVEKIIFGENWQH